MTSPLVLLFDVDGTLIRTGGAGVRAMNRGFEAVMGWPDALHRLSLAGMTDMGIAHLVSRRRGRNLTPEEMESVFARYLDCLREELAAAADFRILPGIREFLEEHRERAEVLLGLGTGNLETGARVKLEHARLFHYFRCGGYGSDAVERAEVLQTGVRRAAALLGGPVPAGQVVIIGDTPLDVRAGRNIGARTLAVATGPFTVAELADSGADGVVESFADRDGVRRFFEKLL